LLVIHQSKLICETFWLASTRWSFVQYYCIQKWWTNIG